MIEQNQTYKCNVCGNIIKVIEVGGGDLMCCMAPMELVESENSDEKSNENE